MVRNARARGLIFDLGTATQGLCERLGETTLKRSN